VLYEYKRDAVIGGNDLRGNDLCRDDLRGNDRPATIDQ